MPISDLRELVVTFGRVLSLLLLVQLYPLTLTYAQRLPTSQRRNGILKNEQNTFLNSFIVEMDLEKNVYLFHKEKKDFFFTVPAKGFLSVTVTPCASEITWSLSALPERKGYRGYRRRKSRRKKQQLVHFKTESRRSFQTLSASPGDYTLSMTSLHTDSKVKVFVTRSPTLPTGYPQMPANATVATRLHKRNLFLSWPSASTANRWLAPVEYCIGISLIKNFGSHCALLAHKHGDRKPQYPRWSLSGEKERINRLRAKANPIRKVKRRLLFHQCIGDKTSFSYPKIKRGKKYFIDVFVVNSNTNQTSSYSGTVIERKKKKKKKKKKPYSPMWVGDTQTISLKQSKGFEVSLNQTVPMLVFEVVPCSGKVVFAMAGPRKKRRKQPMVRTWKRMIIKKAKPGVYRMTFPGKRKKSSYVTVSVASTISQSNAILPKKRNIKVNKSRTSCSNVTLEWAAESFAHDYCVYKRTLGKDGRDARKHSCLSPSERPSSERVLCASHAPKSSTPSFHVQALEVTRLEPSTWYRFDVFVRYGQSMMIPYKSVTEKTKENCHPS